MPWFFDRLCCCIGFTYSWPQTFSLQPLTSSGFKKTKSQVGILFQEKYFKDSPVDLPDPGIELGDFLTNWAVREAKEQASFNFLASVTIWSDFGAQENKIFHCFHCVPIYLPWIHGTAMILVFWMLNCKSAFSLSSFTFIKKLFSSTSLSAIRVVSSAYLRFLIFLLESWFQLVLLPAQHFSWCTLHIS